MLTNPRPGHSFLWGSPWEVTLPDTSPEGIERAESWAPGLIDLPCHRDDTSPGEIERAEYWAPGADRPSLPQG